MAENELALLRRFVEKGDAEAFSELVRRHAGMVYGACVRILDDQTHAADAVQETFMQLLRDAEKISESVPNWLHRVATHKCLDLIRRESRRRRREATYAAGKVQDAPQWDDVSIYVDEAMNELDGELREILIMHFFEGHTTNDIAASDGISQSTVSRRIESGVSQLRMKLHNRGVLVAVGALGSLLAENSATAAPAMVVKELGKLALAGVHAVTAGAATGASTAAGGSAQVAAGAVAAALKGKIIAAAVIAAVGIGGVATYEYVSRSGNESRNPPATTSRGPVRVVPKADEGAPVFVRRGDTGTAAEPNRAPTSVAAGTEETAGTAALPPDVPRGGGFGGYGAFGGGFYGGTVSRVSAEAPSPEPDANVPGDADIAAPSPEESE